MRPEPSIGTQPGYFWRVHLWLELSHAGDNRDCTYLSTLPLSTLDSPGKVLLVAGINYVNAGQHHPCRCGYTVVLLAQQPVAMTAIVELPLHAQLTRAVSLRALLLSLTADALVCPCTAGLATYMSVSITDPVQQKGLLAFDDADLALAGAAAAAALAEQAGVSNTLGGNLTDQRLGQVPGDDAGAASTVLQALQWGLLYVVAVSRNCSGTLAVPGSTA